MLTLQECEYGSARDGANSLHSGLRVTYSHNKAFRAWACAWLRCIAEIRADAEQ